jgi:hypothetical protein
LRLQVCIERNKKKKEKNKYCVTTNTSGGGWHTTTSLSSFTTAQDERKCDDDHLPPHLSLLRWHYELATPAAKTDGMVAVFVSQAQSRQSRQTTNLKKSKKVRN